MGKRSLEPGQLAGLSQVTQPSRQSGSNPEHRGVLSWATSETVTTAVTVNISDTAVHSADQKNKRLSLGNIIQGGNNYAALKKARQPWISLPRKEVAESPQSRAGEGRELEFWDPIPLPVYFGDLSLHVLGERWACSVH